MEIEQAAQAWGIAPVLVDNLKNQNIQTFFRVQMDVIPTLVNQNASKCIVPQDICVSAPTGSGKTLAYVLPILNTLLSDPGASGRLRSLVLLPSRELAIQVHKVFIDLAQNTGIIITLATGQRDFEEEQGLIMGPSYQGRGESNHDLACCSIDKMYSNSYLYSDMITYCRGSGQLGSTDVLVCTAGRLLEHLQLTRGFTLSHLRFLIMDEADRLLGNAYHSWVRVLISSAGSISSEASAAAFSLLEDEEDDLEYDSPSTTLLTCSGSSRLHGNACDADSSSGSSHETSKRRCLPSVQQFHHHEQQHHTHSRRKKQSRRQEHLLRQVFNSKTSSALKPPMQRLLFSATLTDNPSKLALLGVYSPLLIRSGSTRGTLNTDPASVATVATASQHSVKENPDSQLADTMPAVATKTDLRSGNSNLAAEKQAADTVAVPPLVGRFSMPPGLSEGRVVCDSEKKPLKLISLLLEAFLCNPTAQREQQSGSTARLRGTDGAVDSTICGGSTVAPCAATDNSTLRLAPTLTKNRQEYQLHHQHRGSCSKPGSMCIIFTSSVDETHRLCRLLELVNGQLELYRHKEGSKKAAKSLRGCIELVARSVMQADHGKTPTHAIVQSSGDESAIKKYAGDVSVNRNCSDSEGVSSNSMKNKEQERPVGSTLFGGKVVEMSRLLRVAERERVMSDIASGKVSVLVSSDQMARGIDLPAVKLVVNYEPPTHVKTYVHRAGRTARAQESGLCVTMLNVGQLGTFRTMRGGVDGVVDKEGFKHVVRKCSTSYDELLSELYSKAIEQLPKALKQDYH